MTERKRPGISWDSFVEQQIREAQEAGKFDDLPGFGKPIPGIDEPLDELWWVRQKIRRENLSLLPPALQIRADVAATLQEVWRLKTKEEVRGLIEQLNERIRRANFAITWGPASCTMPLEVDEIVRQWELRRRHAPG